MVDLTKDNFEEEVLKAEGTVLVDFYGDGCVPCQALMPHIHAMEGDYGDKIKFTSFKHHQGTPSGNRTEDSWSSCYRYLQGR